MLINDPSNLSSEIEIVEVKPKYYRVRGRKGFNRNAKYFSDLIKLIGIEFGSNKVNSFSRGLSELRKSLIRMGYKTSNTEIRNLISSRYFFTEKENENESSFSVYRVSAKADVILNEIFQLLKHIEKKRGRKISDYFNGIPEKDYYWRQFVISECDMKMKIILDKTPKKHYSRVKLMVENISELSHSC